MQEVHCEITGRVQGVGFRHFTQVTARDLGLTGWVRNNADGSVTAVAQGDKGDLEQFVQAVHQGPSMAQVEDVSVNYSAIDTKLEAFSVRRDY